RHYVPLPELHRAGHGDGIAPGAGGHLDPRRGRALHARPSAPALSGAAPASALLAGYGIPAPLAGLRPQLAAPGRPQPRPGAGDGVPVDAARPLVPHPLVQLAEPALETGGPLALARLAGRPVPAAAGPALARGGQTAAVGAVAVRRRRQRPARPAAPA